MLEEEKLEAEDVAKDKTEELSETIGTYIKITLIFITAIFQNSMLPDFNYQFCFFILEARLRAYEKGEYGLEAAVDEVKTIKRTLKHRENRIEELTQSCNTLQFQTGR